MRQGIDLTGEVFGLYTVLRQSGELHPELAEKANTCVSVMRKCVQLLSLLRDARELKARICTRTVSPTA